MRLRYLIVCVAAAALVVAPVAHASFPGANGKIAFDGTTVNHIFTVNADGSSLTDLGPGANPAWSPDGKSIAFVKAGGLHAMNGDGTNDHLVYQSGLDMTDPAWSPDGVKLVFHTESCSTGGCGENLETVNADGTGWAGISQGTSPNWSPDGTRIVFASCGFDSFCGLDIETVRPDGSDVQNLTRDAAGFVENRAPSWSPDGSQIAFAVRHPATCGSCSTYYTIDAMKADGTGTRHLTSCCLNQLIEREPDWSPDGSKVAFVRHTCDSCVYNIYVMNADGSGPTALTTAGGANPDWQPIPQTYARPKGATPFKTFLVVAYKPCTAPDRTHGAPLAFPSCTSPQQASDSLTVGTGDANGADANSVDSVRYDVHPGNPATAADEADVAIQIALRDIRNRSDLSDYTGELQLATDLRITDRDNTPNPGGPGPGTVEDAPLPATVGCAATSDTTTGAVCNLTTSADALFPGAVKEGRRAIWQLGQVRAYDGGPDGVVSTTAGNTLFMDEGVFIP